jgi:VWFA-related protein
MYFPICVASVALLAASSFAQTTIKSKTEMVVVPTIVRDSSGKMVDKLAKEDFAVLEDGKAVPIAFFEETRTDLQVKAQKTEAGEYTNALQQGTDQKRMTIIVMDMLNTAFEDQSYARLQLLKYLEQSLDVREPTALFALGKKGLVRLHDFTQDNKALLVALRAINGEQPNHTKAQTSADLGLSRETIAIYSLPKPKTWTDPAWEVNVDNPFIKEAADTTERLLVFQNGDSDYASVQDRITVGQTLTAMQQIAHAYEGISGRKALIWATGGLPL